MRISDWSSDVCSSDLIRWISVSDPPIAAWTPLETDGRMGRCLFGRATEELWDIHDRMLVILHPDERETWLLAPSDEAMRRYPAEQLVVDRTDESWFKRKSTEPERSEEHTSELQ